MTGRRGRRPHGDEGVTLVELLVSMTLFSVVLAALGAVVVGSLGSVRFSTTKTRTTADARIAMEAVSRTLRVAVQPEGEEAAVLSATPTGVSFYASLDRGGARTADRPTRVTYSYGSVGSRTCLVETQVPASDNTGADRLTRPYVWTATGVRTCLAETAVAPSFAYFDTTLLSDPATGAPTAPLAVPSTGLALAERGHVVSVQLRLAVRAPGSGAPPPVLVDDRVALTNLVDRGDTGGTP